MTPLDPRPLADPALALDRLPPALRAPLDAARRIVVAIPDPTRPLDVRPALAALAARWPGRLEVVVGLGLHRPLRPDELAPLQPWAPRMSDPDDDVAYGAWAEGPHAVPGRVTRAVAGAEALVTVGLHELHQYAGTSGGAKGVVVGCGGRATIAALHARALVTDPRVRLGRIEDNPFRAAIEALGAQLPPLLALGAVGGGGGWLAGAPGEVLRAAAAALDPWEEVDGTWAGAVLRVPPAKGSSLYQASRAATYLGLSPRPPLVEGATLVLEAACPEGLGAERGFVEALRRVPPPWTALLEGPEPTGPGAQRAVMLALLARRYRLQVRGCPDPAPLRAVGLDAEAGPAPTGPGWLQVPSPFLRLPQARG